MNYNLTTETEEMMDKKGTDHNLGLHVMLSSMLQRKEQESLKEVILEFDPYCTQFYFNEQRKFGFLTASSEQAKQKVLNMCKRYCRETKAQRTIWRKVTVVFETEEERDNALQDWQREHVAIEDRKYEREGNQIIKRTVEHEKDQQNKENAGGLNYYPYSRQNEMSWENVFRVTTIAQDNPKTFSFPLSSPVLSQLNDDVQALNAQDTGVGRKKLLDKWSNTEWATDFEKKIAALVILGNKQVGRKTEMLYLNHGEETEDEQARQSKSYDSIDFRAPVKDSSGKRIPLEKEELRLIPSSNEKFLTAEACAIENRRLDSKQPDPRSMFGKASSGRESCNVLPKEDNFGPQLKENMLRTKMGFGHLTVRRGWNVRRAGSIDLNFPSEDQLGKALASPYAAGAARSRGSPSISPLSTVPGNPAMSPAELEARLRKPDNSQTMHFIEFEYPMRPWFVRERIGGTDGKYEDVCDDDFEDHYCGYNSRLEGIAEEHWSYNELGNGRSGFGKNDFGRSSEFGGCGGKGDFGLHFTKGNFSMGKGDFNNDQGMGKGFGCKAGFCFSKGDFHSGKGDMAISNGRFSKGDFSFNKGGFGGSFNGKSKGKPGFDDNNFGSKGLGKSKSRRPNYSEYDTSVSTMTPRSNGNDESTPPFGHDSGDSRKKYNNRCNSLGGYGGPNNFPINSNVMPNVSPTVPGLSGGYAGLEGIPGMLPRYPLSYLQPCLPGMPPVFGLPPHLLQSNLQSQPKEETLSSQAAKQILQVQMMTAANAAAATQARSNNGSQVGIANGSIANLNNPMVRTSTAGTKPTLAEGLNVNTNLTLPDGFELGDYLTQIEQSMADLSSQMQSPTNSARTNMELMESLLGKAGLASNGTNTGNNGNSNGVSLGSFGNGNGNGSSGGSFMGSAGNSASCNLASGNINSGNMNASGNTFTTGMSSGSLGSSANLGSSTSLGQCELPAVQGQGQGVLNSIGCNDPMGSNGKVVFDPIGTMKSSAAYTVSGTASSATQQNVSQQKPKYKGSSMLDRMLLDGIH